MDFKILNPESENLPSSSSIGGARRRSNDCNSPEFEFWMVRNPSFPQPDLHSADELFADGVLLPLHLLSLHNHTTRDDPPPESESQTSEPPDPPPESSPAITDSAASATTSFSSSKRWRDIFRKKTEENKDSEEKEKEKPTKKKKREKNKKTGSAAGGGGSTAELNINIWPFSRSRSAGNASTRPKFFAGAPVTTRKVNSAPCSRSNSAGESKSRKWPSSPGRPGVHLGRSSPVWQVRRVKETHASRRSKVAAGDGGGPGVTGKTRVLNLNVPICIGYRHNLSCRSDEKSTVAVGGGGGGAVVDGGAGNAVGSSGGNLFNLRNLFTKKSVVTSH